MMRRTVACALLAIGLGSEAYAGHVYGTLFQDNQILRGAPVVLRCGDESNAGSTDTDGVYRLYARTTGSCTLVLEPDGRRAEGSLYSYDRPTGYDFDVVSQGGRWVLVARRR